MKNTAFLGLGLVLLLAQALLFDALSWIPFSGIVPSLLLPIIIHMGVHEFSLARGAALSCVLGYGLDLIAAAPVGLFTFVFVATFLLARAAGVRLAAQHIITQVPLAFLFSTVQSVMILVLLAIFSRSPQGAKEMVSLILPQAVSTALFSPLVFRWAGYIHQNVGASPHAGRGFVS